MRIVVVALDAEFVWPVALTVTEAVSVPEVTPVLALTVIVTFVFAPGASDMEVELRTEGTTKLVPVESESVRARLKVVLEHPEPVSLFFTLTV